MRIPMLHARTAAEGRTQEDQKRAFVFSIPRCRRDSIWNEGDIILASTYISNRRLEALLGKRGLCEFMSHLNPSILAFFHQFLY